MSRAKQLKWSLNWPWRPNGACASSSETNKLANDCNDWKADIEEIAIIGQLKAMLPTKHIGTTVAAAMLAACQSATPSELVIKPLAFEPPNTCSYSVEGKIYTVPADETRFVQDLKQWATKTRRATVGGDGSTPYKCFGWAVFVAQRAGFKRVGFSAQPPQ